jgi:hypothetical protein
MNGDERSWQRQTIRCQTAEAGKALFRSINREQPVTISERIFICLLIMHVT